MCSVDIYNWCILIIWQSSWAQSEETTQMTLQSTKHDGTMTRLAVGKSIDLYESICIKYIINICGCKPWNRHDLDILYVSVPSRDMKWVNVSRNALRFRDKDGMRMEREVLLSGRVGNSTLGLKKSSHRFRQDHNFVRIFILTLDLKTCFFKSVLTFT